MATRRLSLPVLDPGEEHAKEVVAHYCWLLGVLGSDFDEHDPRSCSLCLEEASRDNRTITYDQVED